jgi:anti-sigma-K factor RskA
VISCQDADVLAAALSVGSLDQADDAALQQHLSSCADCRRLAAEYMAAASRLPLALELMQPSPQLRTRLMKAVYAEAAAQGRAEPAAAASLTPASWWRRAWLHLPAGRGFTVLAGAAAAAVIAVTSWTVATRPGAPAPSGSQTVAVAITAMPLAPQAHGQLVLDRANHQAVLTVTGLPGPTRVSGGDSVYEVWLLPASGPPVAGAFLTKAPDGTWDALIRGDMTGYASVAATVEPAGGSSVPTGPEVLQASIARA